MLLGVYEDEDGKCLQGFEDDGKMLQNFEDKKLLQAFEDGKLLQDEDEKLLEYESSVEAPDSRTLVTASRERITVR